MKVTELKGAQLDYWVARAEGLKKDQPNWVAYSTMWSVGGPIMERAKISVCPGTEGWIAENWDESRYGSGPTILIAAMRCFVASKFGEEVPDAPTAKSD
jgi:hypothetical protein